MRFTTPSENFANQHTSTDTFANSSPAYATRVARMNGAALASLALAPKPPVVTAPRGQGGFGGRGGRGGDRADGAAAGAQAGGAAGTSVTSEAPAPALTAEQQQQRRAAAANRPGLARGKTGYDAALRWANPNPEPDLAGYAVVIRETTSPVWQREIYVGNVTEYTIPDLSIDDVVIGVKAIDKDGNQSLVSAYEQGGITMPQRPADGAAGAATSLGGRQQQQ